MEFRVGVGAGVDVGVGVFVGVDVGVGDWVGVEVGEFVVVGVGVGEELGVGEGVGVGVEVGVGVGEFVGVGVGVGVGDGVGVGGGGVVETVNELLVPDFPLPLVEIVIVVPVCVRVTEPVHVPVTKAVVLFGLIVPRETFNVLVPV